MTDRPFFGLVMALAIESSNWLPFRWKFSNTASSLAWRLSCFLTLITGTLIWLDGDRYTVVPRLLTWFPILLLPIQFVQLYGFSNTIELRSLSFFSRFYHNFDKYKISSSPPTQINFGNVYFFAVIIAAGLGYHAQHLIFYPSLAILSGWLIFHRLKTRIFALLLLLSSATALGFAGQMGISKLYVWFSNRDILHTSHYDKSPTISKTSIGSLGEIKQSPEIFWRITTTPGDLPPSLLRLASYNNYRGINWRNNIPDINDEEDSFRALTSISLSENQSAYLLREPTDSADINKDLPSFHVRGRSGSEKPLPLPGNTYSLQDFELDDIQINPLGSVRVFPKRSIIDGTVHWNATSTPDEPPYSDADLEIEYSEFDGIHEIASQLGLKDLPTTSAKIARINHFFTTQFTYTRYLTISNARATRSRPTAIETFLTTAKSGHCEYFATSATLLLRAAGVPSRYCVGFAVIENKNTTNEWIIRGTHGHAWTRVWDQENKRWFDYDPTPSSWINTESQDSVSRTQWLADAFQIFREDFFIWRNKPNNRLAATIVFWLIGLSLAFFIGRRLWKSKVIIRSSNKLTPYTNSLTTRTPLHELETSALKILQPRKPSETLPSWLLQLKHHGLPLEPLNQAIEIHQRLRFDPATPHPSLLIQLSEITSNLRKNLPKHPSN
jgi:protein-glutamine gamma-glutamyltransferase